MTNLKKSKTSIIDKFQKKDGICNICQLEKELSDDHVPPKACPPAKSRIISKLLYEMIGYKSFRPRISQNGVVFKTICEDCNNRILGHQYDWALGEFSTRIESFLESSLSLPESFEVECYPNAVMRSVLGHLLAAKTETDEVVIDNLIRPCIKDKSLPVPDDISIFYWIYPYEETVICRDFVVPIARDKFNEFGFFNLVKFYPLAFLVTYKLHSYEGLQSLHKFNKLPPSGKANVQINLRPVRQSKFPEAYNLRALGRTANDSVYSIPKKQK
ncbi:hypothetical protein [Aulosira sp. FACHB-615]|uniref:hypothetical protein n=1 Tax=Aulosira sp. FACHB-615 TaxID=2692777 RepID=UPI00168559CD|nr:hypothetical protein [Aulosira sp. FACHB-615]MBD2490209.1 hypothetical protein [Aulosira sp. FACHB-615]